MLALCTSLAQQLLTRVLYSSLGIPYLCSAAGLKARVHPQA